MTKDTDKNIHLQGHLDVPSERMDAVLSAVTDHIALTHAEEGCLSFEVTPCSDVQGRFLVAETFKNRAAFDQHQARTKASPWANITAGLPRDYKITEGS
ncbi:MAG: antibiotic biosynthesis monooxygenase [Amylibacter sp.]